MKIKIWLPILMLTTSIACAVQPQIQTAQNSQQGQASRVDAILSALEKRSDDLKDIHVNLRFVEDDQINLTKRIKIGQLKFMVADPNPLFAIHFERTEVDDIVGKQEWYLFDGHWLYEANERLQQVTQREFARPGEKINLFDLETAPFPLPFGQKKETILRNFNVELKALAKGDPDNTDHLICKPKPESKFYGKYDSLEFFIHQTIHLPTRIVITKNEGLEINTADFPGLSEKSINTGVKKKEFKPQREWKKYRVVEERMD